MENEVVKVLMDRDELTKQAAEEEVMWMRKRVSEGEDPEEVLYDSGLEPDYIYDII